MRKLFTDGVRLYTGFLLLVALIICGSASANAAETVDLGVIEFGKKYDLPQYQDVIGTIVIPADAPTNNKGKVALKQERGNELYLYSDQAHTKIIQDNRGYNDGDGVFRSYYELEKGATYYVAGNFIMSSTEVTYYLVGQTAEPLTILTMSHDNNSTWGLTSSKKNLTIKFNQDVEIPATGHILEYLDRTSDLTVQSTVDVTYNKSKNEFNVYDKLAELITAGVLLPGNEFTLTLAGIKSLSGAAPEEADADGNLVFTYKVGSEPMVKVSEKIPATFLSYFAPGNPEGQVSLTFKSGASAFPNIPYRLGESENTKFVIGYGNVEEDGKYYYKELPVKISEDGLTITADLSGEIRTIAAMFPTYPDLEPEGQVTLGLLHVVDQYGNPVKADSELNIGSFYWGIPYKEIKRANISAEFSPSNGSTLEGVDKIEVYLTPIDQFSFTGFKVSYKDGDETKSVVIKKGDCTVSDQNATEATYTFAVPAEVKGKKNITVTLDGLVCEDGYDHTTDVMATYDAFVITYSDPTNNSELKALADGQVIKIETNYSEKYPEMYIMYQIEDMNPKNPDQAMVKSESWMTRQDDGSYTAAIPRELTLFSGHTYHVEFTAWETEMAKNYKEAPVGEAYITLLGQTAPYVPSDLTLVSISPAENTTLTADQREFTLTFDGMVNLDPSTTFILLGQGMTTEFESIVPVDPEEQEGKNYSPEWKLTVSESFMSSLTASLMFSVVATDMEGRRVQGNLGEDDQSYFLFEYEVASQYAEYELKAVGEEPLAKVKEFTASNDRGINYSYYLPYNAAYVVNKERAIVAYVENVILPEVEEDEKRANCTLVLDKEITEAGEYSLIVPKDYFIIGKQFDSQNSAEMSYEFTVFGGAVAFNVAFTPQEGNVTSLPKEILMMFRDYTTFGLGSGHGTLVIDGGEPIVLPDVAYSDDAENIGIITLPQEYTEAGTYTVTFPAGCFNLGDNGETSPEFSATWTILGAEQFNITTDPAQGNVTSLKEILITFMDYSEAALSSGKATLSINGGTPVNLPDAGFGDGWNQMIQYLGQEYTADGTYVITFPAGYFNLDSETSPEFSLTYTIGDPSAVTGIQIADDGRYHVYTIDGVEALDTDNVADLRSLAPGLYIINNVKICIK